MTSPGSVASTRIAAATRIARLSQPVVARSANWYTLHAQVVDTSGRSAGTYWYFMASENARN